MLLTDCSIIVRAGLRKTKLCLRQKWAMGLYSSHHSPHCALCALCMYPISLKEALHHFFHIKVRHGKPLVCIINYSISERCWPLKCTKGLMGVHYGNCIFGVWPMLGTKRQDSLAASLFFIVPRGAPGSKSNFCCMSSPSLCPFLFVSSVCINKSEKKKVCKNLSCDCQTSAMFDNLMKHKCSSAQIN